MLSATHDTPHASCWPLPTTCHISPASCLPVNATQQVSGLSMPEHRWEQLSGESGSEFPNESVPGCVQPSRQGVYRRMQSGVYLRVTQRSRSECTQSVLGRVFTAYLGAYSQAGWECRIKCNWECTWKHTWECTWECAWECSWKHPQSVLGSVHSSSLGVYGREQLQCPTVRAMECTWEHTWRLSWECTLSVLGSVLREQMETYSQAGWEHVIECSWEFVIEWSWECTWERAQECACEHLESLLVSIQLSRVGVYHWEQLGAVVRACQGVYLGTYHEVY